MLAKRATGVLVSEERYRSPAGDPNRPGVEAIIYTIKTQSGQHIGTIHDIVDADGTVLEWHAHDYIDRVCLELKRPDKPPVRRP